MEQRVSLGPKAYNKDRTAQTDLYSEISKNNVRDVFTYNYDPHDSSLFGAKAIAYETIARKIEVCFFSQGSGRVGNNVHHRDVFANILELQLETPEFKSYHKVLEVIAQLYPMDGPELYEAGEKVFTPGQGDPDLGRRFIDEVVKCGAWDDAFIPLLELPERIANLAALVKQRSNHDLEKDSMFNWIFTAQGYQFSARRSKTGLIIESAEMDSSLTSLQRKYPQETKPELYKIMNAEVLYRISPELRRFKKIEIPSDLGAR